MVLKQIERYPDYYINQSGIIVDSNNNLIRQSTEPSGRSYCHLNGNFEYTDKLVAETFLKNSENLSNVIHIDGDPYNHHLTNLNWTNDEDDKKYDGRIKTIYQVYNDDESIVINCIGREEVAKLIGYEIISLKNMIGNGRKISLGQYKGFMIRNTHCTI